MNISPHRLTFHPAVELFPRMPESDYRTLVESIRDAGEVTTPIVLDPQGAVIDGRHRVEACIELDIEVPFRTYRGDDIFGHVIALNLHRRHLTESQRAMVAAKMATFRLGDNQYIGQGAQICAPSDPQQSMFESDPVAPQPAPVSQSDAAQKLNVSRRAVQSATTVRNEGTPELVSAVESGKVSVSVAAKAAKSLTKAEQIEAMKADPGKIGEVVRAEVAKAEAQKKEIAEANAWVDEMNTKFQKPGFDPKAERERVHITHKLYNALEAITNLPEPAQVLSMIPEWAEHKLSTLDGAVEWINAFQKLQKEKANEAVATVA